MKQTYETSPTVAKPEPEVPGFMERLTGKAGASSGTTPTIEQQRKKQQDDKIKLEVKSTGSPKALSNGDIAYVNNKGESATVSMNPPTKGEGIDAFGNKNWKYVKAREVWKNPNLPQQTKNDAFKKLGVDPQDVRYDYLASHTTDVSAQYIASKSPDHETLLNNLLTGRVVSVTGAQFASNAVIDQLYNEGLLSKEEQVALKKIKVDKAGKSLVQAKAGGKAKKMKWTIQKAQPAKVASLKEQSIKFSKPPAPVTVKQPNIITIKKAAKPAKFQVKGIKVSFASRPRLSA
jgi:hypothetical protein